MRIALLSSLVLIPLVAWAGTPDPEAVSDRLTTHLGVSPEMGDQIAAIVVTARAEGEALRSQVQAEALALRAARQAGDVPAMATALDQLQDLQDQTHTLQAQTRADVAAHLTVEQQAAVALHHLAQRAKVHEVMQSLATEPSPLHDL